MKPLANSPTQESYQPNISYLSDLINKNGMAALLVSNNTFNIMWSSSACQQLDERLVAGCSLKDVVEIYSVLQQPLGTTSTIEDAQGQQVTVCSVSCHDDQTLLQLEREHQLDNYYRQYVADREKLFNTSRALTVNEMATTLAHELNQPIGTVVNLLHGCLDRLQDQQVDEEVMNALDYAIRQAQFASQIISRIRQFTEARQPSIEKLDIRLLIHESLQLLDWVLSTEHIDFSVDAGDDVLEVACDRMLLQQVLVNLCRNAIEAMRDTNKRHLQLRAYRSDDGVHIDIADTGPGMADDAMSEMFTPFVSSKRDGMGVGLNICRSFIELHQGKLWVTRNEHQGCTVHILFRGDQ